MTVPVPTPPKPFVGGPVVKPKPRPLDVFHATTSGSTRTICLDEARRQAVAWYGTEAVTLRNTTSTAKPHPSTPGAYTFRCDSWWCAS